MFQFYKCSEATGCGEWFHGPVNISENGKVYAVCPECGSKKYYGFDKRNSQAIQQLLRLADIESAIEVMGKDYLPEENDDKDILTAFKEWAIENISDYVELVFKRG